MDEVLEVYKTYKYRLYRCDKRDAALHHQINVAGCMWNHALALQKRYYRLYGKHLSTDRLKSHFSKLRMRTVRYQWWRVLGSQAVQDVLERLDEAWQRFFTKLGGMPRFRKVKRYKSFTLKQTSGWKLLRYNENKPKSKDKWHRARGELSISGVRYKFVQHRPLAGVVKTVTIKRDSAGRLWVCFSVIEQMRVPKRADLSDIGGFDYGLRHFLTDHTCERYMHPEFFRQLLHRIRTLNRSLSRKVEGSHNRERAKWLLARTHIRIADRRRDFHFKLARALCQRFDVLVFETLNMAAMKRLWGRKVSDLGFTKFLKVLEHVAFKTGKRVIYLDRFEPTTQTCSCCGERQQLSLKQRWFDCSRCGLSLDRDHNAAINIRHGGVISMQAEGSVSPDVSGSPI